MPDAGERIAWRDLVALDRREIVRELTLSLPWLAASSALAWNGRYLLALPFSFMFFLTGLRQVHNAYHDALGIDRRTSDRFLALMSVLMLGSMHAVRVNHLRHHKDPLGKSDVEAACAKLPAWRAIAEGPLFPFRLIARALVAGNARDRRWVRFEMTLNVAWIATALALRIPALEYHVAAMALGQCFAAFFCVWTVHHDVSPGGPTSRTSRSSLLNVASYSMFLHLEHHLYPRVPTCHLDELARRIDAAFPERARLRVLPLDTKVDSRIPCR